MLDIHPHPRPDLANLLSSQTELARCIRERALERWGDKHATEIVGRHPTLIRALETIARFAESDSPILITGETGTGKELFARAVYLLSRRNGAPFLSVNCAQYQDGQLIASELFGHKKGSFTGALSDHAGVFEAAHRGALFLDEIAELSLSAQAMLLRTLGEGEIVPVGETRPRHVDVRVIAATSLDLKALVAAGRFRADLYYRLRFLQLEVPPVRQRGDDWRLMVTHYLERLGVSRARHKSFSREALALLSAYEWPGNVRELKALVDTGFHLSDSDVIEPRDFIESLEAAARAEQFSRLPLLDKASAVYRRLRAGEASFWEVVHRPYMNRELSRTEAAEIVALGLADTGGSYKRLLSVFGIAAEDYLRFMDFLRHHRLKPHA
jgi:transcriptional regulator with GAF, ATPase, and Fis domain